MVDSKRDTSPPPMPVNSTIVCLMAVRNGQFYSAPIGSNPNDSDSWHRVGSLGELAARLGVGWKP